MLSLFETANATVVYKSRDVEFIQYFQLRPQYAGLYSQMEANFDTNPVTEAMRNLWVVPITAVIIYSSLLYLLPKIMKSRDKMELTIPFALWNLLLSVFSTIGMIRTVPHLLLNLSELEFKETICQAPYKGWGNGATGVWVMLFIISKVPELLDTIFLMLKKKPVEFLHWYHHITVLLYCWHAYATEAGTGLYFVAMNYSVHAVMYGYFFLMTLKLVPKWFPSWLITIAQIAQMFGGTFVCCSSWYYVIYKGDSSCNNRIDNLIAAVLMYGSYLYLFVSFGVRKFIYKEDFSEKSKKLD